MNDLAVVLPDIEGETTSAPPSVVGQSSGFCCRRCHFPTLVGDKQCDGCGWGFSLPTMSKEMLQRMDSSWTSGMFMDRTDAAEIERSRHIKKP